MENSMLDIFGHMRKCCEGPRETRARRAVICLEVGDASGDDVIIIRQEEKPKNVLNEKIQSTLMI